MLTSKMCLDFNQLTAGFFHNRGPPLQQHSDLLCYTVVSTLYVPVEINLGSLHWFLGDLFQPTSSFFWE
jgi:hypothetical protein